MALPAEWRRMTAHKAKPRHQKERGGVAKTNWGAVTTTTQQATLDGGVRKHLSER